MNKTIEQLEQEVASTKQALQKAHKATLPEEAKYEKALAALKAASNPLTLIPVTPTTDIKHLAFQWSGPEQLPAANKILRGSDWSFSIDAPSRDYWGSKPTEEPLHVRYHGPDDYDHGVLHPGKWIVFKLEDGVVEGVEFYSADDIFRIYYTRDS